MMASGGCSEAITRAVSAGGSAMSDRKALSNATKSTTWEPWTSSPRQRTWRSSDRPRHRQDQPREVPVASVGSIGPGVRRAPPLRTDLVVLGQYLTWAIFAVASESETLSLSAIATRARAAAMVDLDTRT